ncbi:hypothetical protein BGZ65_011540, partial [Modicella reniformis]
MNVLIAMGLRITSLNNGETQDGKDRQTLKPFDKGVGLINLKQQQQQQSQQQRLAQEHNVSSGNSISAPSQYQSHHQTNHDQASSFVSGSMKTMNPFQATNEQEDE